MAGAVKKFAPEIDAGLDEEIGPSGPSKMSSRSVISSKGAGSITFTMWCHLSTVYAVG